MVQGGHTMSVQKYLESLPLYEITRYRSTDDYSNNAVAFTGTVRTHPYDPEKIILIPSLSRMRHFYEFRLQDIRHADEMSSLATEHGESMPVVKLWIRKGAYGLMMKPFEISTEESASEEIFARIT
jgi:hypothetical protein